jgi:hypothetical protein
MPQSLFSFTSYFLLSVDNYCTIRIGFARFLINTCKSVSALLDVTPRIYQFFSSGSMGDWNGRPFIPPDSDLNAQQTTNNACGFSKSNKRFEWTAGN